MENLSCPPNLQELTIPGVEPRFAITPPWLFGDWPIETINATLGTENHSRTQEYEIDRHRFRDGRTEVETCLFRPTEKPWWSDDYKLRSYPLPDSAGESGILPAVGVVVGVDGVIKRMEHISKGNLGFRGQEPDTLHRYQELEEHQPERSVVFKLPNTGPVDGYKAYYTGREDGPLALIGYGTNLYDPLHPVETGQDFHVKTINGVEIAVPTVVDPTTLLHNIKNPPPISPDILERIAGGQSQPSGVEYYNFVGAKFTSE
ncbi:hypothetical protein GF362_05550 [Candidatus Dojkabacteria bacterium]|nr:hypothetical protein [Candidatus Dojkabacteria bacterium]